jgi:hypothetical protein
MALPFHPAILSPYHNTGHSGYSYHSAYHTQNPYTNQLYSPGFYPGLSTHTHTTSNTIQPSTFLPNRGGGSGGGGGGGGSTISGSLLRTPTEEWEEEGRRRGSGSGSIGSEYKPDIISTPAPAPIPTPAPGPTSSGGSGRDLFGLGAIKLDGPPLPKSSNRGVMKKLEEADPYKNGNPKDPKEVRYTDDSECKQSEVVSKSCSMISNRGEYGGNEI